MKSKEIKQYYKQQQFNVMQTAVENVGDNYKIQIVGSEHLPKFNAQSNLSTEILNEIHRLGYKIVKA